MDLGLKNRVIIVTGATGRTGESIVRVLSEEGALVANVERTPEDGLNLTNEWEKFGGYVFSVESELTEPAVCEKVVEVIAQRYGRIDGLVNITCADDAIGPEAGNHDRFMESLHNNLVPYYLMAHFALPYLKISRGAIVNINSKTTETGQGHTSSYAAASGGRNALTREWAVELLKYGIRVNAVIVSENRMPIASEIAHTVAFLLSEKSSHTTGQLIHVNGKFEYPDKAVATA